MKKTIQIVVPLYNEEMCVRELCLRLIKLFAREPKYVFEVILVNNGSTDNTESLIRSQVDEDKRFILVNLSRNFRMDGALTAGMQLLNADIAVFMAGDLQDPPELVSEFLRKYEEGFEHVYGIVTKRLGTPFLRRVNSKFFYVLAGWLSNGQIQKNVSDFRLVDRKVYSAVAEMKERNRFVRGLFSWVGFNSVGILFERPPRFGGVSHAHTLKVLELAAKGIFINSMKPLRIISMVGLTGFLSAIFAIPAMLYFWRSVGVPFEGFGVITMLLTIGLGLIFLLAAFISEYIGMIFEEVKQRPNFIISEVYKYK